MASTAKRFAAPRPRPDRDDTQGATTTGGDETTRRVTPTAAGKPANGMDSERSLEDRIRERAYFIYVKRGFRDGDADRDWLDAEQEILSGR
jgi:DUF2934 family protein